ncbi:MAG: DUF488 domain-containing protein [Pelolinea sp.]|nr:DUF488 domain-containing protein [Pelolinea sp.]
MKLYTIGFEGKFAQEFFELIKNNQIDCLVDIRILPTSDDAGFASQRDLPYLLKEVAGCDYKYMIELAPTLNLLDDVHRDHDHDKYARGFHQLMEERKIPHSLDRKFFEKQTCCLLCFEATAEFCHRRLVVERVQKYWEDVEVIHL